MPIATYYGATEFADQEELNEYTVTKYGLAISQPTKSAANPSNARSVVIFALMSEAAENEATTAVLSPDGTLSLIASNTAATPEQVYEAIAGMGGKVLSGLITSDDYTTIVNMIE